MNVMTCSRAPFKSSALLLLIVNKTKLHHSFIKINFCPSNFLSNGTVHSSKRCGTCGTSKPFLVKITRNGRRTRHRCTPQDVRNVIHTPILHVNMVLLLDLHIPNFEALNLNTSTVFVRLEMSTRSQSFTHLRTCTKDFFKSSFLHTISTNISTHVLTRFVLIAHANLVGKRLVFLAFSPFFSLFSAVLPLHHKMGTTFSISSLDCVSSQNWNSDLHHWC